MYIKYTLFLIIFTCNLFCSEILSDHTLKWENDIDFFEKKLIKTHPQPFFKFSKKDFQQDLKNLKKNLSNLNDKEIRVELMQIVAQLGDAHTSLFVYPNQSYCLPFQFYWFEEGIFITQAIEKHQTQIGAKLVSIEDIPIEAIIEKISLLIPAENEYSIKNFIPKYLKVVDILDGLKITKNSNTIKLGLQKEKNISYIMISRGDNYNEKMVSCFDKFTQKIPLSYRYIEKNFWSHVFPEERILYFQYNKCQNTPQKDCKNFALELSQMLKQKTISSIILDIRFNSGGSSLVFSKYFLPIIKKHIKKSRGSIFLLTGRKTFSASMWVIRDLLKLTNVTTIGEPTSNKLNHFGEIKKYQLPYSKNIFTCSSKYFHITSDNIANDFYPEFIMPITWEDYSSGIDKTFDWAFEKAKNSN